MRQLVKFASLAIVTLLPAIAAADGLIYQLPDDGAWVRFEVNGKGVAPDGAVTVTVAGTQTISSVGRYVVNDEPCRWIEFQTQLIFQSPGAANEKLTEVIKLLIPEKFLAKGKNPRDHVRKAYKGASADSLRELDLKGDDAREVQSMDEVLHAPLKDERRLPATAIKIKQRTWSCEGLKGETTSDDATFRTETRVNNEAPFGVVTYRYEKERRRNNESQGMRTMEWKFVESGKEAKSAAPDAR
jgi:hypothetical protein